MIICFPHFCSTLVSADGQARRDPQEEERAGETREAVKIGGRSAAAKIGETEHPP